jgi:DNA-binding XRE family transcriptional regulator
MSARTKKRRTNDTATLQFVGPESLKYKAWEVMQALGFCPVEKAPDAFCSNGSRVQEERSIPWRDAFPELTDSELPGISLRGARHREGLTQVELAHLSGIPQRHLSEMENGKRAIGKDRARKLAEVLGVNYRIFL